MVDRYTTVKRHPRRIPERKRRAESLEEEAERAITIDQAFEGNE